MENSLINANHKLFIFCRYTMLCGRPPFEMPTLRETFKRISENKYSLPSYLSNAARDLIKKLLNHDPTCRPNLTTILLEDFFTIGFAPVSLSPSFCEKSPRFPTSSHLPRPVWFCCSRVVGSFAYILSQQSIYNQF